MNRATRIPGGRRAACLIAICVGLAGALASAADRIELPVSAAQRKALGIETVTLAASTEAIETTDLPAHVSIVPAQQRVIAAPLAGLVSELRAVPGERVEAGATVVVLKSEELLDAQRGLHEAAVELRLAEQVAQREEALLAEGIIAEARVHATRARLAQSRARYQAQRATLHLLGLSAGQLAAVERGERVLDALSLTAPISGTVLEQQAVVGGRVTAAAPLLRMASLQPLWLEIQVPVNLAARIGKDQAVRVAGTAARGTVQYVERTVDAAQTVRVRARLDQTGSGLRLNQSVVAHIEMPPAGRQWTVPHKALVHARGKTWLFVEVSAGFEPRAVDLLSQTADRAAVAGPLRDGEHVAVAGVAALKALWQGESRP